MLTELKEILTDLAAAAAFSTVLILAALIGILAYSGIVVFP